VTDQIRDGIRRLTAAGIIPTATIQFGQHTETMDDAEASIRLIRECLAMSPNMQWNFTLTTPFPGSSLYDMLLSDGRIRDHGEFYSRYFGTSRPGAWRQVVNVSAMTDQQVLDMRDRAWGIYMEHKARVSDKDINQPC
jgi:radical SAM superfamily enzyme YgiQ (UPF0313 family)